MVVSRRRRMAVLMFALPWAIAPIASAAEWKQYADVGKCGWSAAGLDDARQFATSIGTAALMIVDHGHVVAAWGAIDFPFKAASMRKSIYDAVIGATRHAKPFDVNSEIGELGIDDLEPLSEVEKHATFEQLMMARSGVYHPAAYETRSNADRRPPRGSAKPGAQWYYNNWDFNVVCVAYERLTGESMADAFARRLAKPLGMEDFEPSHIYNWFEPRTSRYPAVTFRMSARDLARIGQLYLQEGRWDGAQIVSADGVKRSTEAHTVFEAGHYRGEGNGYGRLWWVFPARPQRDGPYEAHLRVAARGAGGQIMVLFPELDLLIVHLADTDSRRGVSDRDGAQLFDKILAARNGAPPANATLTAVNVEALSGQSPKPLRDDLTAIPKARRAALVGRFVNPDGTGIRLYEDAERLFAQPLKMRLPDAEVLQAPDGSLRSPVAPVVFEPVTSDDGAVDGLRMTFRGRAQTGKRAD